MANRINFGQLQEIISPPNLIENQINSFMEFLQLDKNSNQRKLIGLERVFKELFPIETYSRLHRLS
jgi:DNA-directed RNA polymerase subunit beta